MSNQDDLFTFSDSALLDHRAGLDSRKGFYKLLLDGKRMLENRPRKPRREPPPPAAPEAPPAPLTINDELWEALLRSPIPAIPGRGNVAIQPEWLGREPEPGIYYGGVPQKFFENLPKERFKELPPQILRNLETRILALPSIEEESEKERIHRWKENKLDIQRVRDF